MLGATGGNKNLSSSKSVPLQVPSAVPPYTPSAVPMSVASSHVASATLPDRVGSNRTSTPMLDEAAMQKTMADTNCSDDQMSDTDLEEEKQRRQEQLKEDRKFGSKLSSWIGELAGGAAVDAMDTTMYNKRVNEKEGVGILTPKKGRPMGH